MASHSDTTGIIDTDSRFVIDIVTGKIENHSDKESLRQYSHNSERFSFEMPRHVEGHDMTNCTKVTVNYLAADIPGEYEVDDLAVDSEDDDKITFSWLISSNVTQKKGKLRFAVVFECAKEDGTITYRWPTDINYDYEIKETISNDSGIVYENVDILEQWKQQLFYGSNSVTANIQAEGRRQQALVVNKGSEVKKSIPDDYATLSDRVSELCGHMDLNIVSYTFSWIGSKKVNTTDGKLFDPGIYAASSLKPCYSNFVTIGDGIDHLEIHRSANDNKVTGGAFYSAASESYFISGFKEDSGNNISVPDGAKYFRINSTTDGSSNLALVVNGIPKETAVEVLKKSVEDIKADAEETNEEIRGLKEDLESYARIANYTSLTPVFDKKGLYWSCNTDYKLSVLYANEYKFAKAYEVHKGKRYMVCGMSNGTNTSPLVIFSKSYPSEQNKTAPFESFIAGSNSGNSVVTEKHIISPIDGYMLNTISTVYGGYVYEENSNLVADDRYGVYVSNGCYTTFSKIGSNMYLCRVFKNVYINQLFDFNACYIGKFDEYGELYKYKDFGTFPSDVVGPIAIRENSWSATTKFSGGSHGININGTEYPTAKQKFLLVKCGEKTVDADGYYMGRTEFLSTNALYIPMTITGNDLSSAKEGIEEIRHYCIDDVLSVSVDYNMLTDIIADVLYGLQLQIYGMEKVTLPNNEVKVSIDQEQNYVFEKPENKYICTNESGEYCSVEMSTCGLGDFSKNNGESDTKYGYISVFKKPNKIYFQLINHGIQLASGKTLHWDVVCDHKPH